MHAKSLSHVWLFATPWIAAHQASLSFTFSQSLLKLMSTESVMPSNHLILCCPFSSCLQSFPAAQSFPMSQLFASGGQTIGAPASASVLPINIQALFPLGLTDLLAVQGTLKSLLQHHSSKVTILWCSAFLMVQLSHPYMWEGIGARERKKQDVKGPAHKVEGDKATWCLGRLLTP